MKLENWSVCCNPDPYQPPEAQRHFLHGKVYGSANFEDGAEINTTFIARVEDGKVVTMSGSVYELGEVDPGYEIAYPNAKQRVLDREWVGT